MRATVPVLLCLSIALAACQREPSFDERYDKAQKKIEGMASEIDEDLARTGTGEKAVKSGTSSAEAQSKDTP